MNTLDKLAEYQIKNAGANSSEFKTLIGSFIIVPLVGIVNSKFNLDINPTEFSQLIFGVYGAIATYILSRSAVKISRNLGAGIAESKKSEIILDYEDDDCSEKEFTDEPDFNFDYDENFTYDNQVEKIQMNAVIEQENEV